MRVVLTVDCNRIRKVVRAVFAKLDIPCRFLEADTRNLALQALETNNVSLILLDWDTPELDCMDLVRRVRSMPGYMDVPIIMVTSEVAKYNVVEALQNGATDYIVKPIDEKVLKEKISEIIFLGG